MAIRVGIDVGSTTVKVAAVDRNGQIVFTDYQRHNAKAKEILIGMLQRLEAEVGDAEVSVRVTGSVGMGISEQYALPFVQEVVAAANAIRKSYPGVQSMIDIGGEDAKVVFFRNGEAGDLRMNGNCAGGTGAFIDQMAVILGTDVDDLNDMALNAARVYPIASRCGVFCKTDIQNLIAKNVAREDIAASIFHAVAVQTVVTLAHGCDITTPVLFCGGPLTFIPALRKAFIDYLGISEDDVINPHNGTLLPAIGSALYDGPSLSDGQGAETSKISDFIGLLTHGATVGGAAATGSDRRGLLRPIFTDAGDYARWTGRMAGHEVHSAPLHPGINDVFIGIDSGSTTTKIVVTDTDTKILFSFYSPNVGSPIETVARGLKELRTRQDEAGAELRIRGCCSTGYGEDLIKAAFQLDHGIVETMAHYIAAGHLRKDVSFILDIGGQDMKAMFVNHGIIDRIEINEACSSGCGSFIETFAKTLGYTAAEFSEHACRAVNPCDLGTRCTVFMNSKVKQVLREGATIDDIAAGLAYSVVKNCLYKVLKLKDTSVLGDNIVVQGGTMRNDAVVRALELLTGKEVTRCNVPELMGALGCAIYAQRNAQDVTTDAAAGAKTLDDIISQALYTSRFLHCNGCDNKCLVVRYTFANGKSYYSGNRCERVFTNGEKDRRKGINVYKQKNELLFNRECGGDIARQGIRGRDGNRPEGRDGSQLLRIGIPRVLNMFEDYPFWHTLFTRCGMEVVLSEPSRFIKYERSARLVMSDNICFPAKLVHSHIQQLIDSKVDRIFMPFVVFEQTAREHNSFNCPVVSGYAEVVKGVQGGDVPIDAPTITFKDTDLLVRQCEDYLRPLGVSRATVRAAVAEAMAEQQRFADRLAAVNDETLSRSRCDGTLTILLAGRPYHTDPLIQHKVSDMLADMGINVITDDIVRGKDISVDGQAHFLAQWAYPNRILEAALWCARQDKNVQFVQMTSFGCGPDAFLLDEVKDLLSRHGKVLTQLKLDDINNVGSMRLRVRSLVESLKLSAADEEAVVAEDFKTTPVFDNERRGYKILVPFFTPFLSPLIPSVLSLEGYDIECLPMSDSESADCGLEYANNEVCYPATLVVGDLVKAFRNGRYDPKHTAVAMTQTGGQCRASNYLALIKRALVSAGFGEVPVVAFAVGGDIKNNQPGFTINWLRLMPVALYAIVFSDTISKFYYATIIRERSKGLALTLKDKYLGRAADIITGYKDRYTGATASALYALFVTMSREFGSLLAEAAAEFDEACIDREAPRVGIVGEIFLKFNPYAQKDVTAWLVEQGIEVVPPILADFFLQEFVNRKDNEHVHLQHKMKLGFAVDGAYKLIRRYIERVNRTAARFRYFTPFHDIFDEAKEGNKVMTLSAQFGEGWLLPAEIMTYARDGVANVISLQPFGCIANHIVAKGVEKSIKRHYPDINFLSLDFDSGVSDVNVTNRMLLFIDKLKKA